MKAKFELVAIALWEEEQLFNAADIVVKSFSEDGKQEASFNVGIRVPSEIRTIDGIRDFAIAKAKDMVASIGKSVSSD